MTFRQNYLQNFSYYIKSLIIAAHIIQFRQTSVFIVEMIRNTYTMWTKRKIFLMKPLMVRIVTAGLCSVKCRSPLNLKQAPKTDLEFVRFGFKNWRQRSNFYSSSLRNVLRDSVSGRNVVGTLGWVITAI